MEHALRVATLVEERLRELHEATPRAKATPLERIALMVAMSLADELIRSAKDH